MKILPHRFALALILLTLLASAPAAARVPAARLDPALQPASVQYLPAAWQSPDALASGRLGVLDTRESEAPAQVVSFRLDRAQQVRVEILDVQGRVVRTLARGLWAAGEHVQAWYGENDAEEPVAEGLYLVRLRTLEDPAPQLVRR